MDTMTLSQAQKALDPAFLSYGHAETPIGDVTLRFWKEFLIGFHYGRRPAKGVQDDQKAQNITDAYFEAGERPSPILLIGTEFQTTIWKTLATTHTGDTLSYGELARLAGYPRAARAVGQAMNKNPIALFIPCHRVIASDGSLGGFAGHLALKRELLAYEARSCA